MACSGTALLFTFTFACYRGSVCGTAEDCPSGSTTKRNVANEL
jgi:hypothetical protein